ncbi:MAG: OsmC family protein [Archangiaceae bacterium]|nr:OsmC family protein [Archangiaceae bacterium]
MGDYRARIEWESGASGADFVKGRYTREHRWSFDGGVTVPATASPHVVPAPWSKPGNVDPEQALVASISSCHLLTFLYVASKAGFAVAKYADHAVGVMTKNERGIPWVSKVTLTPEIQWLGKAPTEDEEHELHEAAHEQCFIAQSVKTEIVVSRPRSQPPRD